VEPHPSAQHGIYFDGDDYMQVEFNEPLIFDREFTVEMWFHASTETVTQDYHLFQKIDYFGKDTPFFDAYFNTDGHFVVDFN